MKLKHTAKNKFVKGSLPSQGAWIEIESSYYIYEQLSGRSLHRERGLKLVKEQPAVDIGQSRSLHRERGLKFLLYRKIFLTLMSLPSQGAWIEIQD